MTARRLNAVPDTAPRFGIGVRVSRVGGRGGDRFLSPEIQISSAQKAVDLAGGIVDTTVGDNGVFYDMDVSGAIAPSDRPGLGEALDLVRSGHLQGVAIYDLSRWSRETASGLRELEEVAAHGGQVLSASETIDLETPAGVFSTTVQLAAHSLRRAEASRSWKATHERRFEMGLPHGKVPYGYVTADGRAEPHPILSKAITDAFAAYAAGTVSQKDLAERLGRLRGRPMRQGVVSQLLRNRFYLGEIEFKGQTRPGIHMPLVDEETFRAVQRVLAGHAAAGPHMIVPGSKVMGIVRCVICRGPLYKRAQGSRGGSERIPRLICSGKAAGTCEGIGSPDLLQLEVAVRDFAVYRVRLLRDRTPERARREEQAVKVTSARERLEMERKGLLTELGELAAARGKKVMSDRAYATAAGPVEQAVDQVEAKLALLEGEQVAVDRPLEELETAAEELLALWGSYTPLEGRAALRLILPDGVLVRRASYRGERMEARLSLPNDEE